jgi:hypothetical protein
MININALMATALLLCLIGGRMAQPEIKMLMIAPTARNGSLTPSTANPATNTTVVFVLVAL